MLPLATKFMIGMYVPIGRCELLALRLLSCATNYSIGMVLLQCSFAAMQMVSATVEQVWRLDEIGGRETAVHLTRRLLPDNATVEVLRKTVAPSTFD